MDDKWDDAACLRSYASYGNDFGLATLVERYRQMVYVCCQRQVDADSAEDATQTVFYTMARKASSLLADGIGGKRPLALWLMTTASYISANMRRS